MSRFSKRSFSECAVFLALCTIILNLLAFAAWCVSKSDSVATEPASLTGKSHWGVPYEYVLQSSKNWWGGVISARSKERLHICYNMRSGSCYKWVLKVISKYMAPKGNDKWFRMVKDDVLIVGGGPAGERIVPDWDVGLQKPLDLRQVNTDHEKNYTVRLNVTEAYHYKGKRWKNEGYVDIRDKIDITEHRLHQLVLLPRNCANDTGNNPAPWLAQFRNVFVNSEGVVLVPTMKVNNTFYNARAYDMGGGCCESHWSNVKGKTFDIMVNRTEPRVFSTGQYHGSSFFHVMHEQVPRHLAFWQLLNTMGDTKITTTGKVIYGRTVLENMLEALGWPRSQTVRVTEFMAVRKIFMPAPFGQDASNYSKCAHKITEKVFSEVVRKPMRRNLKPTLLILDRATERKSGEPPRCWGVRCIRNMPDIIRRIKKRHGQRVRVRVMRQREGNFLIRGIAEFRNAKIVIGAHGAGFQNMMFMKNNSYALHLGWEKMWGLYGNLAKRYNIDFQNILTKGIGQMSTNTPADAENVVSLVGKIVNSKKFNSK